MTEIGSKRHSWRKSI